MPQDFARNLPLLISLNDKGTRIALKNPARGAVYILDAMASSRHDGPEGARLKFLERTTGIIDYDQEDVALTDRYVAYRKDTTWHVDDFVTHQDYELDSKAIRDSGLTGGTPQFFDDGRLVILTPPWMNHDCKPVRFRLASDGTWQLEPMALAVEALGCQFVGYSDHFLVSDIVRMNELEKPDWLSLTIWNLTMEHFSLNRVRHRLQFWDVQNGKLSREFSYYEPGSKGQISTSFIAPIVRRSIISEDANWLAVQNGREMTVYDVTNSRPFWCWVAVIGLVLMAVWWAWPRKMKLA